jgi:metal-responsive CopG/Arc/MetJ family transcriptional regulator
MGHFMPRDGWVGCELPTEIMLKIDEVVSKKNLGFRSRNAFVLEAVKEHLKKLGAYP